MASSRGRVIVETFETYEEAITELVMRGQFASFVPLETLDIAEHERLCPVMFKAVRKFEWSPTTPMIKERERAVLVGEWFDGRVPLRVQSLEEKHLNLKSKENGAWD